MFTFLRKKSANPAGEVITFQVKGMHCTSCALNIDDALEETTGVLKAQTSYARSEVKIEYNPQEISLSKLREIVREAGYDLI